MRVQYQIEKVSPAFPHRLTHPQTLVSLTPQFQEEGPIIAVQMENEYGSYNLDKRYMLYIKNVSAPSFSSVFTYFSHFADSWSQHSEQLELARYHLGCSIC